MLNSLDEAETICTANIDKMNLLHIDASGVNPAFYATFFGDIRIAFNNQCDDQKLEVVAQTLYDILLLYIRDNTPTNDEEKISEMSKFYRRLALLNEDMTKIVE